MRRKVKKGYRFATGGTFTDVYPRALRKQLQALYISPEARQAKEIAELKAKLGVAQRALEFYAQGKNLEIEGQGSIIAWPDSKNYSHDDWRIGHPYLQSAEMGQVARKALEEISSPLAGTKEP